MKACSRIVSAVGLLLGAVIPAAGASVLLDATQVLDGSLSAVGPNPWGPGDLADLGNFLDPVSTTFDPTTGFAVFGMTFAGLELEAGALLSFSASFHDGRDPSVAPQFTFAVTNHTSAPIPIVPFTLRIENFFCADPAESLTGVRLTSADPFINYLLTTVITFDFDPVAGTLIVAKNPDVPMDIQPGSHVIPVGHFTAAAVPEPSAWAAILGAIGLLAASRRRARGFRRIEATRGANAGPALPGRCAP